MIVVGNFEIAFVHVIKTGGTSVTNALSRSFAGNTRTARTLPGFADWFLGIPLDERNGIQNPDHAPARFVRSYAGKELWDAAATLACVRNPWDLLYSSYRYILGRHDHRLYEKVSRQSFDEFIEFELGSRTYTQWDWISDDNALAVKHVLRFESLRADYAQLAESIGIPEPDLPHLNRSERLVDYRSAYTTRGIEQVASRFDADIQRFGYKF